MKTQRSYARHHAGLILAIASLISAGALMPGTAKVASAQTVYPSWSYTGNLSTARADETATLLQNGKVLLREVSIHHEVASLSSTPQSCTTRTQVRGAARAISTMPAIVIPRRCCVMAR